MAANAEISKVTRLTWRVCVCVPVHHVGRSQELALRSAPPLSYYSVFHHVAQLLPHDCIIVSEGANTMDIGRTMLNNYFPRHR